MSLLSAVQGIKPGVEFLSAFLQAECGVVGDVVAAAHEGVDRAQGFALAAGQNEERVVEVLGGGTRDAAAHGIRHDELARSGCPRGDGLLSAGAHILLTQRPLRSSILPLPFVALELLPNNLPTAARAIRASLRDFEMAGRFPKTA